MHRISRITISPLLLLLLLIFSASLLSAQVRPQPTLPIERECCEEPPPPPPLATPTPPPPMYQDTYNASVTLNQRVLIVYNNNVPESFDVANYYATRRGIANNNLLAVNFSSDGTIPYTEYLNSVKNPIRSKLNALGNRNILYIVFSYRTPYRISGVTPNTTGYGCGSGDPNCNKGTSLDQFVADIWDQTGQVNMTTLTQPGNPYYATSQSKNNVYQPFVSLEQFRNQNTASLTYSVFRLDGPSADIAKGLVDKAISAETNGLFGEGFFDKDVGGMYQHADESGGTLRGDWDIYRAAEFTRDAGFLVTEDNHGQVFGTAPAPLRADNVALYAGTYNLGRYNDAFTWNTGAIGFDFNSDAAYGFRSGTTWSGGALLRGITVTGGAIDEPYAPFVFKYDGVFKNLFEGATIGDAIARNTPALKWRLVNIGDPLYQPSLGRQALRPYAPLPSGWTSVDINASPGSASQILNGARNVANSASPMNFVVQSRGNTLYGSNDSLNLTSTPLDGDGRIVVRISRTEATGYGDAGGVIFRESTAPNARYFALMISGNGQLGTRWRTQTGGDSTSLQVTGGEYDNPYPIWLQIERVGNTFTGYKSLDGQNWTPVMSQDISMPSNVPAGMITLTGSTTVPNKAYYDRIEVRQRTCYSYCTGEYDPATKQWIFVMHYTCGYQ